ncbi:MAG: L-2-hydroxyglutarate oxidase [Verrucomicrobiae bacterium]|nr:L-2-hydroxyglutarate oxidase [Verrucomicrobiae bacterium]
MNIKTIGIIGGGIVGLATALRLLEKKRELKISIFEKESDVGMHQSTHNSGVLHAGLYYKPGSAKAILAVRGIKQMVEFCKKENIPHEICGKLVVAATDEEVPRLKELYERGTANGLSGLKFLESNQFRKYEPNVNGVAAVHVPEEGIVDYALVCKRFSEKIRDYGGSIYTNTKVAGLIFRNNRWEIKTTTGEYGTDFIINCAGLHCDRIARLAGEKPQVRIVPFRGEYYNIKKEQEGIVKNLVYPVPDPKFPFLGVHFTRMIHGGVEAGPNAVLAFSREGYKFLDINLIDLAESLAFTGLWKFLTKYPQMVKHELGISISRSLFCKALQRLVPEIRENDLVKGSSGVRAQALDFDGNLVQDFNIVRKDNALHVLNAPSPAATSSLAIGEHIAEMLPV